MSNFETLETQALLSHCIDSFLDRHGLELFTLINVMFIVTYAAFRLT